MRIWRLSLIALVLAATAACHDSKTSKDAQPAAKPPAPPVQPAAPASLPTELVSLAWTPSRSDQNLQSFDLKLTGLDVLAVCHVPVGWTVRADGAGSGVVVVKGHATVGAAFIGADNLADLAGLFLVRARPDEAFAVRGKLLTGVYADDGGQFEIKATPAILRREAAERCPPPKS